jgi:hypothetical protein
MDIEFKEQLPKSLLKLRNSRRISEIHIHFEMDHAADTKTKTLEKAVNAMPLSI